MPREHFADRLAQVGPNPFPSPPLSQPDHPCVRAQKSQPESEAPLEGKDVEEATNILFDSYRNLCAQSAFPACALMSRLSALTLAAPGSAAGAMCTTAATTALGSRCRRLARQRR